MSYATLLIGLIIWLINKKIKDYVKYRSGLTKSELDFETDIVFLDYLIAFYMKKVLFDFETMNTDIEGINNANYKSLFDKIVNLVTGSLSERYILTLGSYIGPDKLTEYIINLVDYELTNYVMKKNAIK